MKPKTDLPKSNLVKRNPLSRARERGSSAQSAEQGEGEVRYSSGSLPTKYTFTGQLSHVSDFGLLFYQARWYDPSLGRFAQADSLVPEPNNSLDWDRFQYVRSNPLKYNDPTGHVQTCEYGDIGGGCGSPGFPVVPTRGDSSTPYDVGVEWLTGRGDRHHEFREGDAFTALLQQHEYIQEVRDLITQRLSKGDYGSYRTDYKLIGLQGVPKYIKDYSTLATGGLMGNLAVTYLGSYGLEYHVTNVDTQNGTAQVLFHVNNSSTLASATRPPVVGYTKFWNKHISPIVNKIVESGPGSNVTQSFWWTETISFP